MIDLEHGDCLKLMPKLPADSIDMVLADLPYGKTKAKWDVPIALCPLWKQYRRVLKPHGAILLFGMEPFASKVRLSNVRDYRYDWVWHKAPKLPFMAHKRPLSAVEYIMTFYQHLPTYHPQMWKSKKPWIHGITKHLGSNRKTDQAKSLYNLPRHTKLVHSDGWRYPINIIRDSGSTNQYCRSYHPTQKPVRLLEYLICTYTDKGDFVLDNCMGGGSTGVACKILDRSFVGMEITDYYYRVAKKRIEKTRKGEQR